jgi:photosystem II stability/assembly factor-like uncharacterized protein
MKKQPRRPLCFLCSKPVTILPTGKPRAIFCDICLDAGTNHPDVLERAVMDELEAAGDELNSYLAVAQRADAAATKATGENNILLSASNAADTLQSISIRKQK